MMAGCSRTVGTCCTKTKRLVNSKYAVLTVGCVVIHVALSRMTLAPGAFVRDDVIRFGKICRNSIQRRIQVVNVNENSVRRYVVTVAGVIVRGIARRQISRERIGPGARTDAELASIHAGAVCVGGAGAKTIASYSIASKAACV